jgi:hypothetical protein
MMSRPRFFILGVWRTQNIVVYVFAITITLDDIVEVQLLAAEPTVELGDEAQSVPLAKQPVHEGQLTKVEFRLCHVANPYGRITVAFIGNFLEIIKASGRQFQGGLLCNWHRSTRSRPAQGDIGRNAWA